MEKKKTALITGGSRGIGRAICLRLAKEGMNIAFTYTSRPEEAAKTEEACRALGAQVLCIKADVSDPSACLAAAEQVKAAFGAIDVLVNNAGITRDDLLLRMTEDDFDAVLKTNAYGTFHMLKAVSKIMLRQRSGSIINMSSIVGVKGNAGQINYAASKAAVIGMTKSLAREVASRGIRVNALAPGMIETDMTSAMPDQAKEAMEKQIPMGYMGSADDIAAAAAFLASEDSRYITGQVLVIDGGLAI
ncbi:MAG: 3-oxoacyl-[acyl-carrier-protein] reductase [Firmicutes bacterium]|nr:3-oxoacyl-[acyl-carrier-protein] reductase [Bacillota bacterium]